MPQIIQANSPSRGLKAIAQAVLDNCYPYKLALGFECYVELFDRGYRLLSNTEFQEFEGFLSNNSVEFSVWSDYARPPTSLLPQFQMEGHKQVAKTLEICTSKNNLIAVCNAQIDGLNYEPVSAAANTCTIS